MMVYLLIRFPIYSVKTKQRGKNNKKNNDIHFKTSSMGFSFKMLIIKWVPVDYHAVQGLTFDENH